MSDYSSDDSYDYTSWILYPEEMKPAEWGWPDDLRGRVLAFLFKAMSIDEEWSVKEESGFTWWPFRLAQRVTVSPEIEFEGMRGVRVVVETDVGTGAPTDPRLRTPDDPLADFLATYNTASSLSAFARHLDGQITLAASMIVHPDTERWVPRTLMGIMGIQAFEAGEASDGLGLLLPEPAYSAHPTSGQRTVPDELVDGVVKVLEFAAAAPLPGLEVFQPLADMLNEGGCMSFADDAGLSAEIPFGSETSLLQVTTDIEHGRYGRGVSIVLHVPCPEKIPGVDPLDSGWLVDLLNRRASSLSADGDLGHHLGGWIPGRVEGTVSCVVFLPNALSSNNEVFNIALGQAAVAAQLSREFGELMTGPGPSKTAVERALELGLVRGAGLGLERGHEA